MMHSVWVGSLWSVKKIVDEEGTEVMDFGGISAVAVVVYIWDGRFGPAVLVSSVQLPVGVNYKDIK